MEDILVSVWCQTYNHEAYIKDAIEGFLAQKVNFSYEIIIHDDASTDRTADIVKEYEQRYPDRIRGIYQEENQYSKNWLSTKWIYELMAKNCKGKYIAVCEGDDYWIDVQKLQIQTDYLEQHPECVMTIHNGIVVNYENNRICPKNLYENDCVVSEGDIIKQKIIPLTASGVYRHRIVEMHSFYLELGVGDYTCLLYSLTKGSIYYFNRIMSVYRFMHSDSWTSSILQDDMLLIIHNVSMIDFLRKYDKDTGERYRNYIISRIQKSVTNIMVLCEKRKKKEFEAICEKCNKKTKGKYSRIFEQLQEQYMQLYDKEYMSYATRKFIDEHETIVIMGAGRYAKIAANQIISHNVDFKGFAVSDDQRADIEYRGKKIWKLGEIQKDAGIIIGINPLIWDQIIVSLEKSGLTNYICPFLLE